MQFYERYTFLEFFDREEIVDQEVSISRYIISLEDKSIFCVTIFLHERSVTIKLAFDNINKTIFEISISDLERVSCTDDSIYFFKKSQDTPFLYQDLLLNEPSLVVRVKPTVFFQCDI